MLISNSKHIISETNYFFYFFLPLMLYKMNYNFRLTPLIFAFFAAEHVFSQDVNKFSSDENKFSVGFQLSGAFPVGSFTNADISFPCNSSVSTGSAFELSLGYKINSHIGGTLLLSEALYELDASSRGVAQLISQHQGVYQNASVFKSGQLTAQSVMVGAFYDLTLSKSSKMFGYGRLIKRSRRTIVGN